MIHIKSACVALAIITLILLTLLVFPVPVYAATITANPTTGSVGTSVLISGQGFVGRVATIYWDEQVLAENVPVTETGDLTHTVDIPRACKGEHLIEVTDREVHSPPCHAAPATSRWRYAM